jgi:hypothetical protein
MVRSDTFRRRLSAMALETAIPPFHGLCTRLSFKPPRRGSTLSTIRLSKSGAKSLFLQSLAASDVQKVVCSASAVNSKS